MQLTAAYVTSHMHFGRVIWGHALGFKLSLHDGTIGGSAGKLGIIYRNALRWSISAPAHTRGAALYLIAHAVPLQGLISKQMVRYFGRLEHELKVYKVACQAGYGDEVRQPRWAAWFVRAAMQEVIARRSQSSSLRQRKQST